MDVKGWYHGPIIKMVKSKAEKRMDRNYNRLADEKKMVTLISINQICKSFVRTVEVLSQWTFGTYTYLRWLKSLWHLSEFFPSFTKSNSWTKVSFKSCRKEKYMHKDWITNFLTSNYITVKFIFNWKLNNLQNPGKCKLWMHPTNQLQQLFTGPDITSKPVL